MAWKLYETVQGRFIIDVDAVCQIIRSTVKAKARNTYMSERTDAGEDTNVFGVMVGRLPSIYQLSVDWAKVNEVAKTAEWDITVALAIASLRSDGMTMLMRLLSAKLQQTKKYNRVYAHALKTTSDKTRTDIERASEDFGTKAEWAKRTRDISGTILLAGASWMTGGALALTGSGGASMAATSLALAGTGIKTRAKYQDTGSLAAAELEASQDLLFVVVPAAKIGQAREVTKIVVAATVDGCNALAEGQNVRGAAATAVITAATGTVSKIVGEKLGENLNDLAIPVKALLRPTGRVAANNVASMAKDVVEDQVKTLIHEKIKSDGTVADLTKDQKSAYRKVSSAWSDRMSLSDRSMLELVALKLDPKDGAIMPANWW